MNIGLKTILQCYGIFMFYKVTVEILFVSHTSIRLFSNVV